MTWTYLICTKSKAVYAMMTYGEVKVQLHHFVSRHYIEMCGQLHGPIALPLYQTT
jgi:hypothetical protein